MISAKNGKLNIDLVGFLFPLFILKKGSLSKLSETATSNLNEKSKIFKSSSNFFKSMDVKFIMKNIKGNTDLYYE